MIRNDAWDKGNNLQYADIVVSNSKMTDKSNPELSAHEGVKISFTIPSKDTMDGINHRVQYVAEYSAVSGIQNADDKSKTIGYSDLFKSSAFYIPDNYTALDEEVKSEDVFNTNGYGLLNCQKWELLDWDDTSLRKTYYVDSDFIDKSETSKEMGPAYGIYFKEYGRQDNTFALAGKYELDGEKGEDKHLVFCSSCSAMYLNDTSNSAFDTRSPKKIVMDMSNEYGLGDVSELNNYYYMKYFDIKENDVIEKIVVEDITSDTNEKQHIEKDLFWLYSEKESQKQSIVSFIDGSMPPAKKPMASNHSPIAWPS